MNNLLRGIGQKYTENILKGNNRRQALINTFRDEVLVKELRNIKKLLPSETKGVVGDINALLKKEVTNVITLAEMSLKDKIDGEDIEALNNMQPPNGEEKLKNLFTRKVTEQIPLPLMVNQEQKTDMKRKRTYTKKRRNTYTKKRRNTYTKKRRNTYTKKRRRTSSSRKK